MSLKHSCYTASSHGPCCPATPALLEIHGQNGIYSHTLITMYTFLQIKLYWVSFSRNIVLNLTQKGQPSLTSFSNPNCEASYQWSQSSELPDCPRILKVQILFLAGGIEWAQDCFPEHSMFLKSCFPLA